VIAGLGLAPRTVPMVFTGITDSRHYVDLAGAVLRFLPLRLTPANRSGIHGVDEHIEEGNYLEIIQFYKALFERCGMT
jgi:carboxypeptidase PM20D1